MATLEPLRAIGPNIHALKQLYTTEILKVPKYVLIPNTGVAIYLLNNALVPNQHVGETVHFSQKSTDCRFSRPTWGEVWGNMVIK